MEDLLRNAGLRVSLDRGRPRGSNELRLRWRSGAPAAAGTPELQMLSHLNRSEPPPRQRSQEISPDHLVIAVVDRDGVVRASQIIIDPRLVRGEFPDSEGNLHKNEFYRNDVEFSIALPDLTDAVEVRILTPQWEGGLKLIPTATLRITGSAQQ